MQTQTAASLRAFGLMWFGQLVSLVGSGISRFALGVWVYERTGSATQYILILLFAFLPGLLTAPLAGVLGRPLGAQVGDVRVPRANYEGDSPDRNSCAR